MIPTFGYRHDNSRRFASMATASTVTTGDTKADTRHAPIVVDMGKQRRKLVKRLRRGTGKLMDEVNSTIEELKTSGTISGTAQPIIFVVREKRRATPANLLPWPL
jgi:hypothetical protein